MKEVDVAIIGAGTAGLSARREVAKHTDNYVVIDDGPLGTTCARVGCMPSKVLIEAANIFHKRNHFNEVGISGGENLKASTKDAMIHVRKLRDRFVRAVKSDLESWTSDHLLAKRARFVSQNILDLGDEQITAKKIIIATGSSPILPDDWRPYQKYLLNTDDFFEQEDLPHDMAVIGLGVIGIELGQALSRLGHNVVGIGRGPSIAGLSDPILQSYVAKTFNEEFKIIQGGVSKLEEKNGRLELTVADQVVEVDKALVAIGRRPNVSGLNLEKIGVELNNRGMPELHEGTYQIKGTPIYFVGDVNGERPILHEAADEGRIAGYNAMREEQQCFRRRTKLGITFSSPNIATIGMSHKELTEKNKKFITGEVSFEGQGRAIVKLEEKGLLHIYVDPNNAKILGVELFAPDGEHLAHLIAWAIEAGIDANQALSLPFYHPVI